LEPFKAAVAHSAFRPKSKAAAEAPAVKVNYNLKASTTLQITGTAEKSYPSSTLASKN